MRLSEENLPKESVTNQELSTQDLFDKFMASKRQKVDISAFTTTFRKEFNSFEITGEKSPRLKMLYDALITIKPISVESEWSQT